MSTASPTQEVATFASGCFWGTEHIFKKHFANKGLLQSEVGYIGGDKSVKNPTYEQVCSGKTGYAEAAQFTFDPYVPDLTQNQVSYAELVEFFYRSHDPTQENAQGPDRGTQYRSAIFAHTSEQERTAQTVTQIIQREHFNAQAKRIVTQIEMCPVSDLYVCFLTSIRAESYHQDYLFNNPSGYQCPTHRLWW